MLNVTQDIYTSLDIENYFLWLREVSCLLLTT